LSGSLACLWPILAWWASAFCKGCQTWHGISLRSRARP
jgi:hypothetical protein